MIQTLEAGGIHGTLVQPDWHMGLIHGMYSGHVVGINVIRQVGKVK
jgi:hypothetical protein